MNDLINIIAFILPVLCIFSVLLLTISNLYLKFRKQFPVRVNCWFCDTNWRVPYSILNSWTCEQCHQYNGFNEDGDYNQDIREQRAPYKNVFYNTNRSPSLPASNGLCVSCNKNQELKIKQLATFAPVSESNYDSEIEAFKQQLEKAYALCKKCKKTLKVAINKTKTVLISSRLTYLRNRGLNFIDLNAATNNITPSRKQQFVLTLSRFTLISLALLLLYIMIQKYDIFLEVESIQNNGNSYFSSYVATALYYLALARDFIMIQLSITKSILVNMFYSMSHHEQIILYFEDIITMPENANKYSIELTITAAGSLLSLVITLWQGCFRKDLVNTLFWFAAYCSSLWERYDESLRDLQIFDIFKLVVVSSLLLTSIKLKPQKTQKKQVKKLKLKCIEESDVSDLEEELRSDSTKCNFSTPIENISSRKNVFSDNLTKPSFTDIGIESNLLNNNLMTTISNNLSLFNDGVTRSKTLGSNYEFGKCYFGINDQAKPQTFIINNMTAMEPEIDLTNLSLSPNNSKMNSTSTLFSTRQYSNDVSPIFTTKIEQTLQQKRPILSPSRLDKPVTQASWIAGGYWSPTKSPPLSLDYGFVPLSRASSQSSGFESQSSLAMPDLIPPLNSFDENDRSSVLSEPAYYGNNINFHKSRSSRRNIVYPKIRVDRPTFIRPGFTSGNVHSRMNTFKPVKPNEDNFNNSIFNFNQMNEHLKYTKGSLLKKWCGENQVFPIDPMGNLQL